jgi:hypothetical protein
VATTERRRRLDLVLDPEFVADLSTVDASEIRHRRRIAELEEMDLSYLRRLLQGRIDIITVELSRRGETYSHDDASIVAHLSVILAAGESNADVQRFITPIEPSRAGEYRRRIESIVGDAKWSDVESRTPEELAEVIEQLKIHEKEVSEKRRRVQRVNDLLVRELARRAEASVQEAL